MLYDKLGGDGRIWYHDAECIPHRRIRCAESLDAVLGCTVECDKIAGVTVFEFKRRTLGGNFAVVENNNIVGIGSLLHVVGREEHRHALVTAQLLDNAPQETSCLRVKPRCRLVEYEYLRLVEQRTGDVDAPSLPAGQLADGAAEDIFKA